MTLPVTLQTLKQDIIKLLNRFWFAFLLLLVSLRVFLDVLEHFMFRFLPPFHILPPF